MEIPSLFYLYEIQSTMSVAASSGQGMVEYMSMRKGAGMYENQEKGDVWVVRDIWRIWPLENF